MRCTVARRAAAESEVEAALASLESGRGMYFGVDAGVAGLHPMHAVVVARPVLVFRVFGDGVEAGACDAAGEALRALVPAAAGPLDTLRGFLAAFASTEAADDALLVGALRFEGHRLRERAAAVERGKPLGIFFFATSLFRRDASGAWSHVEIAIDGVPEAGPSRRPFASSASEDDGRDAADDFAPGAYAGIVARGVERLARGALVLLTLSQSFRRRVAPAASAVAAFARLRRVNPAPVTFCVADGDGTRLFGASPDLQLIVRGRDVASLPVCGTVARGHGALGEAASLRRLLEREVDAASLAVCTDAMRNDLAPLCVPGSLGLADRLRPMALATVVHTVDRLCGTLRDGVDAWDALVATTAPPMLVGTPRAAALAAIDELEASPRGWYGGLVVQVAASGDALVGTLLRAAVLDRHGLAEVRAGGDLLADSVPEREEDESRVKAVSLWRALGLASDAALDGRLAGGVRAGADASAGRLPATVALAVDGDPFAASLADALGALGVAVDAQAAVRLVAGPDGVPPVRHRPAAALADAPGPGCGPSGAGPAADRGAAVGAVAPDASGAPAWEAGGDRSMRRCVAIGDAAVDLLAAAGFATAPIAPAHGRTLAAHGVDDDGAVDAIDGRPAARPFAVARYATRDLVRGPAAPHVRDGWAPWLVDAEGHALALAHAGRRVVCLLFRPESLISDTPALAVLGRALAFAAGRGMAAAPTAADGDSRDAAPAAPDGRVPDAASSAASTPAGAADPDAAPFGAAAAIAASTSARR